MQVQPYIFLNGRCEEALAFYQQVLSANITLMIRYSEAPDGQGHVPAEWADKIMHASLSIDETVLMASDGAPDAPGEAPSGYALSVSVADVAEGEKIFALLSDRGSVLMPFQKTFWASGFGMLVDRFGVKWMVNCEH